MWGLSNRELATLIWLGGLILFLFTKPDVRAAFTKVVNAFLQPKVVSIFVIFALYLAGSISAMARLDPWSTSLLKDTLVWILVSGMALLFSSLDAPKNPHYFRTVLVELVSIGALLTFVYELQSFPFVVEFVLQPLIAIVLLMIAFCQTDPKYKQTRSCLNYLLIVIAINVFFFTAWLLIRNYRHVDPIEVIQSFALPIALTIVTLPFVFLFAFVTLYEDVFLRMKFQNGRRPVPLPVRLALFVTFKGNLHALNSMSVPCSAQLARSGTFEEARTEALKCRTHRKSQL